MDQSELKLGALLLWALMSTADEDLEKFRRQRLGRHSTLDVAHLRRVRDMMQELLTAIRADDDDRWEAVAKAAEMLSAAKTKPDAPAPEPSDQQVAGDGVAEEGTDEEDEEPSRVPAKPARVDAVVEPPSKPLPGLGDPGESPWVTGARPTGSPMRARPAQSDETITDFVHLLPHREPLPFAATEKAPSSEPATPEADLLRARAHVLPFHVVRRPARVDRSVADDVTRYAEFCAARQVRPERLNDLMAEYGLEDDEACLELDAQWNERLASEPELLEQWDQRFEERRAELDDSEGD